MANTPPHRALLDYQVSRAGDDRYAKFRIEVTLTTGAVIEDLVWSQADDQYGSEADLTSRHWAITGDTIAMVRVLEQL